MTRDDRTATQFLDSPCHHPRASITKTSVAVDGDEDGNVYAPAWVVTVPGVGCVGQWDLREESEARRVLAAYHDPRATIRSVVEARGKDPIKWANSIGYTD